MKPKRLQPALILMFMGLFLFSGNGYAHCDNRYWAHPVYRHGRKYVIYSRINNYGHYPHGYYYRPNKEVRVISTKERLGISDVIVLEKAGVNDDVIIQKIVSTGAIFNLTVEEVEALRQEGVSSRVINFMLSRKK